MSTGSAARNWQVESLGRGVFLFRIADGLIAHRIDYRDSADAKRQMDAA